MYDSCTRFFFNLTYSRWTSSLPSCMWSLRIFPSLPGSRLTIFYRDASSALLQLVNQWLNFTYSRSHAFRYERKNTNPTLVRIGLLELPFRLLTLCQRPLGSMYVWASHVWINRVLPSCSRSAEQFFFFFFLSTLFATDNLGARDRFGRRVIVWMLRRFRCVQIFLETSNIVR